ncbi:plasmid pRiA4b ORF-3 family protein [Arabiibacter massiliensis]|uniref:plasmid pRiA4b ORF-3 family protein n=1 Tax=Arabiibacter massiliensis TaxID=1870985 RepID=UPI0009BA8D5F|nr:plasmid pRiA4b ORF-3 family protein [Arabiibacter massiliensis]
MAAKIIEFPGADVPGSDRDIMLYQVKATILESEPPIWRRLLVPVAVDMDALHEFLARSFGWAGYHLYTFEKDGMSYDAPQLCDELAASPALNGAHRDASKAGIGETLSVGDSLVYTYDLGDNWEVAVEVEDEVSAEEAFVPFLPVCLDGERHAPLEDSGGMGGYEDLCRTLADPKDPGYRDACDWAGYDDGADFDPEFFDILGLNEQFAYDMVDAMEDDFLPEDPDELKELCKDLLAQQMVMVVGLSMDGVAGEDDEA